MTDAASGRASGARVERRSRPRDVALDQRRLEAVATQAAAVRWQIVAVALVIAALVWTQVPPVVAAGWAVLVIVAREWRAAVLQRLVDDQARPMDERLATLVRSTAVLGLVNGVTAVFIAWLDPKLDALLTMVLVSWAAGAVSISAPLLRAYVAYAFAVYVPLVVMWLWSGGVVGFAVAGLVAMFGGVQYRFARQNAEVFEESYRIREENAQLVARLAEARNAAEAASRAKSRFLAAASHDLRQPLHALALNGGLLAADPHGPRAAEIAGSINTAIGTLGRLLDSLLDISRLDAGSVPVDRRPIWLHRLLQQLVRVHAPQAQARGLTLTLEGDAEAVVETDPLLVERLLRNLLDNALKYTQTGGVVMRIAADGDDAWAVSVQDSGIGIAPEQQQRIWEEFFQVDARSHVEGLGLGLAIVRRLTDLLGFTIELRSESGHGTCFTVRMPRGASAGAASPASPEATAARRLKGLKVLVIDDEETVRQAIRDALQHFGCDVALADGAEAALALDAGFEPQLALTDLRLAGGSDGLDVLARLRRQHPQLRALIVTGETAGERLERAHAGGWTVVNKPLTLERLRSAMEEQLLRPVEG